MNFQENKNEITEDTTVALVVGFIGSALALFFFFSPISMFIHYKKTSETKQFTMIMFLANTFNCVLWVIIGGASKQIPQWSCNMVGLVFSLFWISWYILICVKDKVLKILGLIICLLVLGINGVSLYYLLSYKENEWKPDVTAIIGYIAIVVNTIMYAGPGQNLIKVIQTGDYCLIPIISSVMGLFCSSSWFAYSLLDKEARKQSYGIDIRTFVPNMLGIIMSLIQIFVWNYFRLKEKNSRKSK